MAQNLVARTVVKKLNVIERLSTHAGTNILLVHKGYPHNPLESINYLSANFNSSKVPRIVAKLVM